MHYSIIPYGFRVFRWGSLSAPLFSFGPLYLRFARERLRVYGHAEGAGFARRFLLFTAFHCERVMRVTWPALAAGVGCVRRDDGAISIDGRAWSIFARGLWR